MTENLPAVRSDETNGREITTADVDSWIGVASDVIKLANLIAPTEFVPRSLRDSPPATAAAILYGREVGLPPMTALTQTHVIEGRPSMSAEAMRALVLAAGHGIEFVETNRARCVIRGRRHGEEKWLEVVWTTDDVRHLLHKDNYKNYPRQMLQARATAELCRMRFPDVIHGFRAIEEFDDLETTDTRPDIVAAVTRVKRAAKALGSAAASAKVSAPAPLEEKPAVLTGPPLPGEEGYTQTTGEEPDPAPVTEEPPAGESQGEGLEPAGDSEEEGGRKGTPARGGADAPDPRPPRHPDGGVAADDPPKAARRPRALSRAQQRGIEASLTALGVDADRDERHLIVGTLLGREVPTFKGISFDEASTLMDTFARIDTKEQLTALLDAADAARVEAGRGEADRWNEGDRS